MGYLITNCDREEFEFINKLKQARKEDPTCWTTLHGNELKESNKRQFALLERWLRIFHKTDEVYYHAFLYRKNERFIQYGQTYEHYFAKQSIFSLACKMKSSGHTINTMFKNVSTLTVLFDGRRSHTAQITSDRRESIINRLNELENIYKEEIGKQIYKVSGKNYKTTSLSIRFSFISAECFDAMQFSDCFLYLLRHKILQEKSGMENIYTKLFDKYFMKNLPLEVKNLGFKKVYEFGQKLNIFESNA